MAEHDGADAWKSHLITTSSGTPKPLLANAITALRECFSWHEVLAFDTFAVQTVVQSAPPWAAGLEWEARPWSPHDDLLTTNWLQQAGIGVNVQTTAQAVETVARDNAFHPVIEYLESLEHDGTPRTNSWVSRYLGAEPSRYNETVGRSMLVAAVARIYDPGCKVDTVPILEGTQGSRKSTAVKTLFYPWFTDELADLGSKDAALQTRGMWGVEISELDAMSRGEVSKIKAFITRTTDRFRPPYGSRVIESDRSCVFWGTTNADGYLKDETGGRRFWPIPVGKIDIDGLAEVRDQLWAEALVLYRANVPWWIVKSDVQSEAEQHQAMRYVGDPWEDAIARYGQTETSVTVEDVLRFGLGLEIGRCGQLEMNRVARVLRSLGYLRRQRRTGDRRYWVYSKPVTSPAEDADWSNVTTIRPVTEPQVVTPEMPARQPQAPLSPLSPPRF